MSFDIGVDDAVDGWFIISDPLPAPIIVVVFAGGG